MLIVKTSSKWGGGGARGRRTVLFHFKSFKETVLMYKNLMTLTLNLIVL